MNKICLILCLCFIIFGCGNNESKKDEGKKKYLKACQLLRADSNVFRG